MTDSDKRVWGNSGSLEKLCRQLKNGRRALVTALGYDKGWAKQYDPDFEEFFDLIDESQPFNKIELSEIESQ